ncbi:uncharacterized protein LOC109714562 isoform X2 [Ananas comosus]|nr:uncharacterized protein LOC109714562 isoform X2 [Ananas comosus]XP_020094840.1 uncharacterized protein LOC109714562 isoform X2 [Ananas comosus]
MESDQKRVPEPSISNANRQGNDLSASRPLWSPSHFAAESVPYVRQDSVSRISKSGSSQRNSASLSRETGDQTLSKIRLSHELADEILEDVDSSVMAQVGDSGVRVVEGESIREASRRSYSRALSRMNSIVESGRYARQDSVSRISKSSSLQKSLSCGSDQLLNSIRLSHELADQLLGDIDSSVMAQVGDRGDRIVEDEEINENGSLDLDYAKRSEDKAGPLPDDALIILNGTRSRDSYRLSPVSPLVEDIVSPIPTALPLGAMKDHTQLLQSASIKDKPYKPPRRLDYFAYIVHLSVFGFLGVLTRYVLRKFFGPNILALTSDDSPLYLDLPSNILGSFLMGWFGIVFKADIRQISDHVVVGLTTGYLGSLTTFSGWNQEMLDLASKGHWVYAVAGIVLGMFIVNESINIGVESGEGLRKLFLKYFDEDSGGRKFLKHLRVDTGAKHAVVMTMMVLILLALWFLSGALAIKTVHDLKSGAVLWLGCVVAPPGVWGRWHLARLNGEGIGKRQLLKWLPIGTLAANVLAACIMAALSTISNAVNTKKCRTVTSGIEFGFLGCLSTVSTFVAEVYAMRQSRHSGRAFIYATATILLSFAMGTLIYSVPVWTKHYK